MPHNPDTPVRVDPPKTPLFGLPLPPVARLTDPTTSHDATPSAVSRKTHMAALLEAIKAQPCTTEEAAAAAGITPWQVATKRTADLKNVGSIRDSGERRRGSSGRLAIVWEANE